MTDNRLYGAIDQGTTSTRFIVFDSTFERIVAVHQVEHKQLTPHPGWLEHDPLEIYTNAVRCVRAVVEKLGDAASRIVAVGITNQRETTVAWSRSTRKPLCNALVWSDARTAPIVQRMIARYKAEGGENFAAATCGLPCSTYFSAPKMRWLLENVDAVKTAAASGDLMFGTIDSWLVYCLTGGAVHATDVSNASRTMLMSLQTRAWDADMCARFEIPMGALPTILPSSADFGTVSVEGLPPLLLRGCVGDQSGALLGQLCLQRGDMKNTFGTGCFLLANVGDKPVPSRNGLLSTVAFQLGAGQPCCFALEGAVAGAGAAVQWLRDKLQFFSHAREIETVAASVPDAGGVAFVPAFGGLLAPHWCPNARGTLVGLTQQSTRAHIARATLEAVAHQVAELVRLIQRDVGDEAVAAGQHGLNVDGGMSANELLMQLQADALGVPVRRPSQVETTARGAAMCAAVGAGAVTPDDLAHAKLSGFKTFVPQNTAEARAVARGRWERAVRTTVAHAQSSL